MIHAVARRELPGGGRHRWVAVRIFFAMIISLLQESTYAQAPCACVQRQTHAACRQCASAMQKVRVKKKECGVVCAVRRHVALPPLSVNRAAVQRASGMLPVESQTPRRPARRLAFLLD